MHAADIKGSIAYTKSLTLVGILTKDEEKQIINGLGIIGKEWEEGMVSISSRISIPLSIPLSSVSSTRR